MKIDIEGSEAEALKGAKDCLNRFHPDLIIETHIVDKKSTRNEVIALIKDAGYTNIEIAGPDHMPNIFAKYQ